MDSKKSISKPSVKTESLVNSIPNEIIMTIFFYIPTKDLFSVMSVCQGFYDVINSELYWKYMSLFQLIDVTKSDGKSVLESFNLEDENKRAKEYFNELLTWKSVYQFIFLCEKPTNTVNGVKHPKIDQEDDENNIPIKTVLLGASQTGKSSIVLRFVRGQFFEYQESTIGAAFLTQTVSFNGGLVKYEIWDTAGQERYASLAKMYVRGAGVAIVVYSIASEQTFYDAEKWINRIKKYESYDDITIRALVGNKKDLDNREVTFKRGEALANKMGMLFFECSAKSGKNVNQMFVEITKKLDAVINSKQTRLDRKLADIYDLNPEKKDEGGRFFLKKTHNKRSNKKCLIQ